MRLAAVDALFDAGSWADVVRESQEIVELALTGLLRSIRDIVLLSSVSTHMEFDDLVNRHKDAVYRQMVRVCGNQADAEDVLQDALLSAYRALGSLRDRAAFQAWLATIARNACNRLKRKEALQPLLDLRGAGALGLAGTEPSAESQVVQLDLERCVKAALSRLPDASREVLELRDLQGLTAPDAAGRLGISVPALKSRLHRARTQLRHELDTCFR